MTRKSDVWNQFCIICNEPMHLFGSGFGLYDWECRHFQNHRDIRSITRWDGTRFERQINDHRWHVIVREFEKDDVIEMEVLDSSHRVVFAPRKPLRGGAILALFRRSGIINML